MEFGDFDQALQWMQERTEEANGQLAPEQQALTWGATWVRFYDELVIFGRILSREEMIEAESQVDDYEDPEEAKAEAAETVARLLDSHERGYMFGKAYSVIEPDGEYGDTHRADMWPISEACFEDAQAERWEPAKMEAEYQQELVAASTAWMAHRASIR
jgi:hypothetical protein